jgi:hypothetical protein
MLMFTLVVVVIGSGLFFLWHPDQIDLLQKFLSSVLTPLVALVGAVTGFYYAEKALRP